MMQGCCRIMAVVACLGMLLCASCSNREEFGGLGIEVPTGEGIVTAQAPYKIVEVFEGGTGHRAGLLKEDVILSVDGMPLEGMQHGYIVENLLRGKVGSVVHLEVRRDGQVMVFALQRGRVQLRR